MCCVAIAKSTRLILNRKNKENQKLNKKHFNFWLNWIPFIYLLFLIHLIISICNNLLLFYSNTHCFTHDMILFILWIKQKPTRILMILIVIFFYSSCSLPINQIDCALISCFYGIYQIIIVVISCEVIWIDYFHQNN